MRVRRALPDRSRPDPTTIRSYQTPPDPDPNETLPGPTRPDQTPRPYQTLTRPYQNATTRYQIFLSARPSQNLPDPQTLREPQILPDPPRPQTTRACQTLPVPDPACFKFNPSRLTPNHEPKTAPHHLWRVGLRPVFYADSDGIVVCGLLTKSLYIGFFFRVGFEINKHSLAQRGIPRG